MGATIRVAGGRPSVTAGGREWPVTLDLRDGTARVEIDGRSWRVRPQRWIEKRRLARFAHYGEAFVRAHLYSTCVDGSGEPQAPAADALLAVAAWLDGGGGAAPVLPLDHALLTRVTIAACRELGVAPTALDDLTPADVESVWHGARQNANGDVPVRERADGRAEEDGFTHRIVIVPDGDPDLDHAIGGDRRLETGEPGLGTEEPGLGTGEPGLASRDSWLATRESGPQTPAVDINRGTQDRLPVTFDDAAAAPSPMDRSEVADDDGPLPEMRLAGSPTPIVAASVPHRPLTERADPDGTAVQRSALAVPSGASAGPRARETARVTTADVPAAGPPPRDRRWLPAPSIDDATDLPPDAHADPTTPVVRTPPSPSRFRVVSGILAPQDEPRVSRAAGLPGAAGGFTTGASLPIASSPTRPSRHTAVTAVDDAAGPFTPPAPAGDPPPRPRSFHEFADEFGERLQAAASELGLLGER